jgi:hypothetical protein
MVKNHGNQIKDDKTYEKIREQGASKEKAARIANAQAKSPSNEPSRKGGQHGAYEDWSKDDLYQKAKQVGIAGRSRMNKGDLINALRTH